MDKSSFDSGHPIYSAPEAIVIRIVDQAPPHLQLAARAIQAERFARQGELALEPGRLAPLRGAGRPPIVRTTRCRTYPAEPALRRARIERRVSLADLQHVPRSFGAKLRIAGKAICAVLAIEAAGNRADRHRRGGRRIRACELTLSEIAARSFTAPTTVRETIDLLEALGVVTNQDDRRGPDGRNLPNRVIIVCRVWLAALMRRFGLGSDFPCALENKGLSLTGPHLTSRTNAGAAGPDRRMGDNHGAGPPLPPRPS